MSFSHVCKLARQSTNLMDTRWDFMNFYSHIESAPVHADRGALFVPEVYDLSFHDDKEE